MPERIMVRKLYHTLCEVMDEVGQVQHALMLDVQQVCREVRDAGWHR